MLEKELVIPNWTKLKIKWRFRLFRTLEGGRGGHMPKYGYAFACRFTLFGCERNLSTLFSMDSCRHQGTGSGHAARKYLQPQNRAIVFS